MQKDDQSTFFNRREWGSYLSALQSAAAYPNLVGAVKSGRDWFADGASQATHWLAPRLPLKNKLSPG